ncbi:hypothetical protein, partial [Corallococcus exiguus]|uniref:hypothetical protein n=1 Tax=Corallococcus exiguus TaxID=83462 RepID=UPI001C60CEAC
ACGEGGLTRACRAFLKPTGILIDKKIPGWYDGRHSGSGGHSTVPPPERSARVDTASQRHGDFHRTADLLSCRSPNVPQLTQAGFDLRH